MSVALYIVPAKHFATAILLVIPALLFSQTSNEHGAEAPQDTSSYAVPVITVTATRHELPLMDLPYAVSVVGQSEVQRSKVGLSLSEALYTIPGVDVNNRFNFSQGDRISIRGIGSRTPFGVRGIKIILDGIPLTMPDGQSQLNNLDLGSVGRIEILRGPSSSLHGNAAGGLISISTENTLGNPFRFQPAVISGSNGMWKLQGKISAGIEDHTLVINASKVNMNGFREHSTARFNAVNVVGRHDISSHVAMTSVFNVYDAPYLLNPSSLSKSELEKSRSATRPFVKQQGSGKRTQQIQGGVTVHYTNEEDTRLVATLYGLSRSLFNPIPGRIIDLNRIAAGLRAAATRDFEGNGLSARMTIGFDYEWQRDTRREFVNLGLTPENVATAEPDKMFDLVRAGTLLVDQQENVRGLAPFAELELKFKRNFSLTVGARYDRASFVVQDHLFSDGIDDSGNRNMSQVSPMVGVSFRPSNFLSLYANYSMGFQTPTTTELNNQPEKEGGFNPNLQPETIRNIEFGIKGISPLVQLEYGISVFHLTMNNMLISYQIPHTTGDEVFYRNAGKTKNIGAELEVVWKPAPAFRGSLAYTFMSFTFRDFETDVVSATGVRRVQLAGNKVPGVSPHNVSGHIGYEHSSGAYAECDVLWRDKFFANDLNGPPPDVVKPIEHFVSDAFLLSNLRIGLMLEFKALLVDAFVGLNNVFNAQYNGSIVPNAAGDRFFEPAPGRTLYIGLRAAIP